MLRKNTTTPQKNHTDGGFLLKVDGVVIRLNFRIILATTVAILLIKSFLGG
jgi:hypothetical protein